MQMQSASPLYCMAWPRWCRCLQAAPRLSYVPKSDDEQLLLIALTQWPPRSLSPAFIADLLSTIEPSITDEAESLLSETSLPRRPYARDLAAAIRRWRETRAFPFEPSTVPDLVETGPPPAVAFAHLVDRARAAIDARALSALLDDLGPWGILALLRCRRTVGTAPVLPPSPRSLIAGFSARHSPQSAAPLTVGARALAKHAHRSTARFWGSVSGGDAAKNAHALRAVAGVLRDAVWVNVHCLSTAGGGGAHGSGDGQAHGDIDLSNAIYEVRQAEGYGARWSADGGSFRGFVEPQAWDVQRRAAEGEAASAAKL
jgi:hypothetical protein